MNRIIRGIILVTICCCLTSCTHPLKIKNKNQYRTTPNFSHADRPVDIGITSTNKNFVQSEFYNIIIEKLASRPFIGKVQSNYKANNASGFKPDCIVSIEPSVDFKGSGWNWLITFPGFIIFTNAWNGYVYTADVTTKITLYGMAGNVIESFDINTPYKIRHCDFGRGFWSGTGWWFPGFGATNLITGLFMIQYDDGATAPFLAAAKENYSNYIVEKIYNNSSFGTIMSELPKEKIQETQKSTGSQTEDIEITLNKLFEMKKNGLIDDAEYQELRKKALKKY